MRIRTTLKGAAVAAPINQLASECKPSNCSELSPSTRKSPWYRASKSTLMTSALESSIHMTLSLLVTIKESLSHVSGNGGNTTDR